MKRNKVATRVLAIERFISTYFRRKKCPIDWKQTAFYFLGSFLFFFPTVVFFFVFIAFVSVNGCMCVRTGKRSFDSRDGQLNCQSRRQKMILLKTNKREDCQSRRMTTAVSNCQLLPYSSRTLLCLSFSSFF